MQRATVLQILIATAPKAAVQRRIADELFAAIRCHEWGIVSLLVKAVPYTARVPLLSSSICTVNELVSLATARQIAHQKIAQHKVSGGDVTFEEILKQIVDQRTKRLEAFMNGGKPYLRRRNVDKTKATPTDKDESKPENDTKDIKDTNDTKDTKDAKDEFDDSRDSSHTRLELTRLWRCSMLLRLLRAETTHGNRILEYSETQKAPEATSAPDLTSQLRQYVMQEDDSVLADDADKTYPYLVDEVGGWVRGEVEG